MIQNGDHNAVPVVWNVRIPEVITGGEYRQVGGLDQLTEGFKIVLQQKMRIPCTACHYCVLDNDCPKKIQIPELFSCYNLKTTFHSWNTDYYYKNILTRDHGKASACLKCGKCEKICPQHLPIRKLLEQVAEEFEKE